MGYPLQALLEVREAEEEAASREVAREIERVDAARRKAELARRVVKAREEALDTVARDHDLALAAGRLTAADVRAQGLFLERLRAELARARQALGVEEKAVLAAEAAAERAREALAAAILARKALESHRDAFVAEEEKARERAAEEVEGEIAARRRK